MLCLLLTCCCLPCSAGYACSPTSSSSSSDSSGSDSGSSSDVDGADSCCTSPSSSSSPWSVDPEFQAVLPHLQSRPATGPTPAEARYLSQPIYTPATPSSSGSRCQQLQSQAPRSSNANPGVALGPGVFHGLWCKAGSGPARVRLLKQWLADMDAHMGQQLSQVREYAGHAKGLVMGLAASTIVPSICYSA